MSYGDHIPYTPTVYRDGFCRRATSQFDMNNNQSRNTYLYAKLICMYDSLQDKHYLCVLASDTPDQNLAQYFPICNDFIHAARLRGGNVLIHW